MQISTYVASKGKPDVYVVCMSDDELAECQRLVEADAPSNHRLAAMLFTIRKARHELKQRKET